MFSVKYLREEAFRRESIKPVNLNKPMVQNSQGHPKIESPTLGKRAPDQTIFSLSLKSDLLKTNSGNAKCEGLLASILASENNQETKKQNSFPMKLSGFNPTW
ncbi:MAG: hypothetical protein IMZ46_14510 [Acidobacteria bacterium]|nr:hypothetical protein [Acidobacteriota bacterium]